MIPRMSLILVTVQSQESYKRDPRPIAPDSTQTYTTWQELDKSSDVWGREPVIEKNFFWVDFLQIGNWILNTGHGQRSCAFNTCGKYDTISFDIVPAWKEKHFLNDLSFTFKSLQTIFMNISFVHTQLL